LREARALVSSIRAVFSSEYASIKMQKGKVPGQEMVAWEHRFNLSEFKEMYMISNIESKARLSVTISLGWRIGELLSLKPSFIKEVLKTVDSDGFVAFDYKRKKTGARIRGILNPCAVHDLTLYLERVPRDREEL